MRHMRADLDAVLDGCVAAGADEIVVCDAHDDGRSLERRRPARSGVTLMGGSPAPHSMMQGIGAGYDGALFVGYHARAGARPAPCSSTPGTTRCSRSTVGDARARRVRHRRPARRSLRRAGALRLGRRQDGRRGRGARARHRHDRGEARHQPLRGRAATRRTRRARACATTWSAPLQATPSPRRSRWNGEPMRLTFTRVAVLRPGGVLPRRAPPRRAHARDRRRDLRGGLPRLPRLPRSAARRRRARSAVTGAQLRVRPPCGELAGASGCSVAGNTSASQAEDRGFESRHPLQLLHSAVPSLPCSSPRRAAGARSGVYVGCLRLTCQDSLRPMS